MIVLDTTVLVYATGGEHPLREPCRHLIRLLADGDLRATTTIEVVQEYVHVRSRRVSRADAVLQARAYADLLGPLLVSHEAALMSGLEVFAASDRLGALDAVLTAVARSADASALVSADRAFAAVPGLRHVLPDEKGVQQLLML